MGFALAAFLFWGMGFPAPAHDRGRPHSVPTGATLDVEAPEYALPQDSDANHLDAVDRGAADLAAADLGANFSPAATTRSERVALTPPELLRLIETRLEPEIERARTEGAIPSLAIALVRADTVMWASAYGAANRNAGARASPETVYALASTFKTFVGATVLQLETDGKLRLDDPVRQYLPASMSIRGEDPQNPVTFLHLLTHTSGLPSGFTPLPFFDAALPPSLSTHLAGVLRIEGGTGAQVRYSNPGYALLGFLVEQITGEPFEARVRRQLWTPLGLRDTAFHPTPEMAERLAVPYQPAPDGSGLRPVAWIRFAEWPAGAAFGTVLDQATWLGTILNGGSWQGARVLPEASVLRAFERPFPSFQGPLGGGWGNENRGSQTGYGLGWWVTQQGGARYIGHSGSLRGFTAFLHGNVDARVGVALLTNGDRAHPHLVRLSFLATELLTEWIRSTE